MQMDDPAMSMLATIAMMVAMMLPSIVIGALSYGQQLGAESLRTAASKLGGFVAGYGLVWGVAGLGLTVLDDWVHPMAPFTAIIVLTVAGIVQLSPWRAARLARCRSCAPAPGGLLAACRSGTRVGIECCLSCAAAMAALVVIGLMDIQAMAVVTTAITIERLAPRPTRRVLSR